MTAKTDYPIASATRQTNLSTPNSDGWQLMTRTPTHPGEILREDFMAELGISVAQLAKLIGVSRQSVNELVHERRSVSPDMALRLGKLFGTSPQSWMNLQRNIDLWNSLQVLGPEVNEIEELPIAAIG